MAKPQVKVPNLPSKKHGKKSGKRRVNLPSKSTTKTDFTDLLAWQYDDETGQLFMNLWTGHGNLRITY